MMTGGSWSVFQSFPVLSRAGAAGRLALIEEGARLLGVSPQRCEARDGAVHANGRSILYGDIVARGDLRRAYTPDQLKTIPIKKPADRRLIGKDTLALDVPSKTDGKGCYGIDAAVEGMIYARPKIPPTRYDSKVASIDDSAAKRVPGYIQSLALDDPSGTAPGWVMVYAESFSAANRAADLVKVKWNSGPAAHVSEADLQQRAAALIADPKAGALVVDDPGVDAALASAKHQLERTYTTSTVMHFALEPINALAFEKNGVFEIHTGNQWQTLILPVLAKALGRGQDTIVLRSYLLGGAFGRRLDGDYTVAAALAAKAVGKPVKMVCTRPDDMRFDCPRSPSMQVLRMGFGDGGRVTAWIIARQPAGLRPPWLRQRCKRMLAAFSTIRSPSGARITGIPWDLTGFVRCATISPNGHSGLGGCGRSARAGPTGLSRALWMKRLVTSESIPWRSGCACWTAPAVIRVRRRTLWAVRGARRPYFRAWRRRPDGASRRRKMLGSVSRRPSARNGACPPGSLALLVCGSTALAARSQ